MNKLFLNLFIVFISTSVISCGTETPEEKTMSVEPANYIVLLDLSDRILQSGQKEYDIEAVFQVFEAFEARVRRNLTVNSKDRFCVLIADQQEIPYDALRWENIFFLDMGKTNVAVKNKNLQEMRANLKKQLYLLYTEASFSKNPSDFAGADLWRFFHDRLPQYYIDGMENHLLVLTDGYFDFESRAVTGQMHMKGTTTGFMEKLRHHQNWQKEMINMSYGICPVDRKFNNMEVYIAGLRPKNRNLNELDILNYTWLKWVGDMECKETDIIPFGPIAGLVIF
jgi:hypothetical protein